MEYERISFLSLLNIVLFYYITLKHSNYVESAVIRVDGLNGNNKPNCGFSIFSPCLSIDYALLNINNGDTILVLNSTIYNCSSQGFFLNQTNVKFIGNNYYNYNEID